MRNPIRSVISRRGKRIKGFLDAIEWKKLGFIWHYILWQLRFEMLVAIFFKHSNGSIIRVFRHLAIRLLLFLSISKQCIKHAFMYRLWWMSMRMYRYPNVLCSTLCLFHSHSFSHIPSAFFFFFISKTFFLDLAFLSIWFSYVFLVCTFTMEVNFNVHRRRVSE